MVTRGMFAGGQIWGYHTATDTWVKLEVNADGTLTVISSLPAAQVADLKLVSVENFPSQYPLTAAQVADLKLVTVGNFP